VRPTLTAHDRRGTSTGDAADLQDRRRHPVGGVAVVETGRDQQLARIAGAGRVDRRPRGVAKPSAIGTTIPGNTIGSLTNETGADVASAIKPSKLA
jgi:hypothetical protein